MGIKFLSSIVLIAVTAQFTFSFQAIANSNNMEGPEIRSKIEGKRVLLATKWGIEFPLVYSKSGFVTGDGSGIGLGKFFAPKETGTWWIKGDKMCQQFPTWYDGRTFCFQLEKKGVNEFIWKRDDGATGLARLAS